MFFVPVIVSTSLTLTTRFVILGSKLKQIEIRNIDTAICKFEGITQTYNKNIYQSIN